MFRNQIVKIDSGEHKDKFGKVLRSRGTEIELQVLGTVYIDWFPISRLQNTARLSVKQIGDRTHICQFVARAETKAEATGIIAHNRNATMRSDFHLEEIKDELNRVVFLIWAIGPHDREAINA